MPPAKPRLVSLSTGLVGGGARVVRPPPTPSQIVDDHELGKGTHRCCGVRTRRTAACRAGCPRPARPPTARAPQAAPVDAPGAAPRPGPPAHTPSSTSSRTRRCGVPSRSRDRRDRGRSRTNRVGHRVVVEEAAEDARRPSRARHAAVPTSADLAVDRVLATTAVVGGHERRRAREGLEAGLAEALEPTARPANTRRRVLPPERGLIEVLAQWRSTGTPISRPASMIVSVPFHARCCSPLHRSGYFLGPG